MRHEAIRNLYPNVVIIDDGAGAIDADGNLVAVDESAVSAEIQRLQPLKDAEKISLNRRAAYIEEADPLFFKAQRGEATMEEWLNKVNKIKERFPK